MKSGGQILRNFVAFCEMSKISWQTGNLKMNEDLENHSKGQLYHLDALVGISPKLRERDKARIHQFRKKVSRGIFLGNALIAGGEGENFGKKIF